MSESFIKVNSLSISKDLADFVKKELLPGLDINEKDFWDGFEKSINELAPINKKLLDTRETLQSEIDLWLKKNRNGKFNHQEYKNFLKKIGYLKEEGNDFKIDTKNLDIEISSIAGPQLVVPIMNSRYTLNAANARWVSLYDSLYGTDLIESEETGSQKYDPLRGQEVIKYARDFLNDHFSINGIHWKDISGLKIEANNLKILKDNKEFELKDKNKFIGYRGEPNNPTTVILENNNLKIEIIINPKAFSAVQDAAGISDIIIESAISTICDNEDSVAAVDSEDKVLCYRNWLGLMKGTLKSVFEKDGKTLERKLNPDRSYISKNNKKEKLHGRSLLLIRNVGHLMTNSAIILEDGSEIPEGIMDAFVTTAAAIHDLKRKGNSRTGSIYIVKPKMHGPEETAFTDKIFTRVEEVLKLEKNTIKCGIMDEERRTSVNLKECIRTLKSRVFFINTGFLDRTGDEMHTSMEAGPMIKKGDMKKSEWITAYENNNVEVGLKCGFSGVAQIGKGMWAMPDKMKEMIDQKISHLEAGANCAWVPSPTAASLHAMHYHRLNIFDKHKKLNNNKTNYIDKLLSIPIADRPNWSKEEINNELCNSAQTILGYVVRWVDQGIGCSKVPDINNVGLMEDRATLRISSQHIANWLHHGICSNRQVLEVLKKMAKIVDQQNKEDSEYQNMSPNYDKSISFKAACELIFHGKSQPSGYTEPLLHLNRLIKKS